MNEFQLTLRLRADADLVASEVLSICGVNYELGPLLKMTAPKSWVEKPISQWPVGIRLFRSAVLLFYCVPVDLHSFMFVHTTPKGFSEKSSTLMNRRWEHKRRITENDIGCIITDYVRFTGRVPFMEPFMKYVYRFIFRRRHQKLIDKYGLQVFTVS